MSWRVVGPFNRVEGEIDLAVEVHDGRVGAARVQARASRGFERLLLGRDPRDALVYTPRICGICSVAHSAASAAALREAMGLQLPRNGALAACLVTACENLSDHLTHFYLLFMPDFARQAFAAQPWHEAACARFKAQQGQALRPALRARAAFLHVIGILAGKWPHTLALQPGGCSHAVGAVEKVQLRHAIAQFGEFLQSEFFGCAPERFAALDSDRALRAWGDAHAGSDLGRFLAYCDSLGLQDLGHTRNGFLSYGAYAVDDSWLFAPGAWRDGQRAWRPEDIAEDLSHTWFDDDGVPSHPWQGGSEPAMQPPARAYSWCKAPRLDGRVVETGALARQLVDAHPLALDLLRVEGSSVRSRVVARALELARLPGAMLRWVEEIEPAAPFSVGDAPVRDGSWSGLVEAARGGLGHWLRVRDGRIAHYQIVAPTTWNFSPRDAAGTPGPLEQALEGTPIGAEGDAAASVWVQLVLRSFDPCMACTVH